MEVQRRVTITIDLPLAFLTILMVVLHLTLLMFTQKFQVGNTLQRLEDFHKQSDAIKITLPDRQPMMPKIRTLGRKDGSKKNTVLVTPKDAPSRPDKPIDPFKAMAQMNQPPRFKPLGKEAPPAPNKAQPKVTQTGPERPQAQAPEGPNGRPGTRTAQLLRPGALEQLARSARPVQEVAQTVAQQGGQAQVVNSPTLSKSAVNMQVEVPEGVAEGELNEYELMFYGFQKRMMEKYLNSIILQVREYERKYPQKSLIPEGNHVMTGRVTFDSSGNIKQIKMVRWTNAETLQAMFEDVLKSMDQVPNPPKQLWDKHGDFTVFYNLTVVN